MPNETRNKTGRTLKEQMRAASEATAQQRRAQKEESGKKTTKRHASKSQVESARKSEKEESKKRSAFALTSIRDFFVEMRAPLRVLILFVVAVLVIGVILYPIGCTYYQAMRQEQRYQAELDAVNQRNETIQEENDALDTDEGVENQARQELGWVKDDERAVIVTNGDDGDDSNMPSQVDSDGIRAPRTWYYDILDTVFQYKP